MADRITLWLLIFVVIVLGIPLALFVAIHNRLPMGSGELLNWILGL